MSKHSPRFNNLPIYCCKIEWDLSLLMSQQNIKRGDTIICPKCKREIGKAQS